ncbi:MAG: rod shape-determining protein MreC [Nitrospiraceae bacterium]|nr:rod shape-determining protein MreC [Nitrospiraceae bacterium]
MRGRNFNFLPLILLIILVSALMTYQARRESPLAPAILKPLNGFLYGSLDTAERAYAALGGLFETRHDRRIKALETEVASLKRQQGGVEALRLENARLRALLGLKEEHHPRYVASANVVFRGTSRWANTFVIDAGRRRGIEKDMIAVSPDGLAGKVTGTQGDFSRVLLITDVRFAAAVRIERLGQEAIFSGTGTRFCELKYITNDIKVQKGDVLITSGLDGLFPAGLRVGYVSGVSEGDGFFQDVQVTPYVDTARLQELAVIK